MATVIESNTLRLFSMNLRRLMDEKKESIRSLGAKIGLSPNTVSGYLNQKFEPSLSNVKCIADFFQVSMDDLLMPPERWKEAKVFRASVASDDYCFIGDDRNPTVLMSNLVGQILSLKNGKFSVSVKTDHMVPAAAQGDLLFCRFTTAPQNGEHVLACFKNVLYVCVYATDGASASLVLPDGSSVPVTAASSGETTAVLGVVECIQHRFA